MGKEIKRTSVKSKQEIKVPHRGGNMQGCCGVHKLDLRHRIDVRASGDGKLNNILRPGASEDD